MKASFAETETSTFPNRPSTLVQNASVAASELLREAIITGRLEPGQRLKEEEVARELGISRTPVREALLILQADGLVESIPNRGAVVRSFDVSDIAEIYEVRALLEGRAAKMAAVQVDEVGLKRLAESCDRLLASEDVAELVKENLFFHNSILEMSGNERLTNLARAVFELPLQYRSYFWYTLDQKRISVRYHQKLVNALRGREADRAELIMSEHILEARDILLANMSEAAAAPEGF